MCWCQDDSDQDNVPAPPIELASTGRRSPGNATRQGSDSRFDREVTSFPGSGPGEFIKVEDREDMTFSQLHPVRREADTDSEGDHVSIYSDSSKLAVPLQEVFRGPRGILTSLEASVPCKDLGVKGLLKQMNYHLKSRYTLDDKHRALLQMCIDQDYDFGVAYSLLRNRWYGYPQSAIDEIHKFSVEIDEARQSALKDDVIKDMYVIPRRIWDLWSNRVVPTWMVCTAASVSDGLADIVGLRTVGFFAVSHAWLDEHDRQAVNTPINGGEWPVPIPKATTLERVRTELLHYTSSCGQYAWLDVLCLRQKGKEEDESKRKEEWKLDIPTIGAIYLQAPTAVCYYSGLGLPFRTDNLDSPRHWLNRAWTLQETKPVGDTVIAGISVTSPQMPDDRTSMPSDPSARQFWKKLTSVPPIVRHRLLHPDIFSFITEMRRRNGTTELDRVAGLQYLCLGGFDLNGLSVYVVDEIPESAWRRLMHAFPPYSRAIFLFFFPEPAAGIGDEAIWFPSWHQVMRKELALPSSTHKTGSVHFGNKTNPREYWLQYPHFDCTIRFAAREGRSGTVRLTASGFIFPAAAAHDQSIPDGAYTLLINMREYESREWETEKESEICRGVVGHSTSTTEGAHCSFTFRKVALVDVRISRSRWNDRLPKTLGNIALA